MNPSSVAIDLHALAAHYPERTLALLRNGIDAFNASGQWQALVQAYDLALDDASQQQLEPLPLKQHKLALLRQLQWNKQAVQLALEMPDSLRHEAVLGILAQAQQLPPGPALDAELLQLVALGHDLQAAEPCLGQYLLDCAGSGDVAQQCEALADRPAVHALLEQLQYHQLGVEQLLTALRARLLDLATSDDTALAPYRALLTAIALQCDRNEYVYNLADDEATRLGQYAERIKALPAGQQAAWDGIAVLLMYQPFAALAFAHNWLESSETALHPLTKKLRTQLQQQQAALAQELAYAAQFAAEQALEDATSIAVAQMYEANPYPRWTTAIGEFNPGHLPFGEVFGYRASPHYRLPEGNDCASEHPQSILVAGCGTGRHPIALALNFPGIRFTAIDIGVRSLAYAQRMADHYELDNLQFKRCDILTLPQWSEQFDMVDSTGVIHHMREPEAGLAALLTRLKPGGVLRLGLYSRTARRDIIAYRQQAQHEQLDAAQIRAERRALIRDHAAGKYPTLMAFSDFFSMSGCRDLLLHEQEHQYDLADIERMLDSHQLRFLSMTHEASILQQIAGPQADPWQLTSWAQAERAEPMLFASMYNFFVQQ